MRTSGVFGLSAILALLFLTACASDGAGKKPDGKDGAVREETAGKPSGDLAEDPEVGPPSAEEPSRAKRQSKSLARDERDQDGNFLELLEQRQQTIEELKGRITALENEAREAREGLTKVRESENLARTETERVQGMLQDALIREKSLQEQVLHARLDAVRMEKELYRAKIASLTGSDAK